MDVVFAVCSGVQGVREGENDVLNEGFPVENALRVDVGLELDR